MCSNFLAVEASEDQGFLHTVLLIFIGHAVPTVIGDVLVRFFGQKLQQLHLNSHCIRLLLFVSIAELKLDVSWA